MLKGLIHLFYNIGIALYGFVLRLASPFHEKAKLFIHGRRRVFQKLSQWRKEHIESLIWFHCASLGEFEQGRPIMEQLKKSKPELLILLTFFSPSGYEIRKDYKGADFICYLPIDSPGNARMFVRLVQPQHIVFVKYEYWANYFFEIKKKSIPLFMVSGIFREDQRFFGWQQPFWKEVLGCVTSFYLQNELSASLLRLMNFHNYVVSGDTRFDRVVAIAEASPRNEIAERFVKQSDALIVGSSYETEERIVLAWLKIHKKAKCILAPHEIGGNRIAALKHFFGDDGLLYSEALLEPERLDSCRILIIDNMGMLSTLYKYGQVVLIGGGFGKGIHNTLEAAVYGLPMLFGPRYKKFDEAKALIACGGAWTFSKEEECVEKLKELFSKTEVRTRMGQESSKYVRTSVGATALIMGHLNNIE